METKDIAPLQHEDFSNIVKNYCYIYNIVKNYWLSLAPHHFARPEEGRIQMKLFISCCNLIWKKNTVWDLPLSRWIYNFIVSIIVNFYAAQSFWNLCKIINMKRTIEHF